jgi:hypothetical protein
MASGKCVSCSQTKYIEHVTVRTYRKREQLEYHYTICLDCLRVLHGILESNADGIQRGIFDHASGEAYKRRVK